MPTTAQNDREIWVRCDDLCSPFECCTECVLHIVGGVIREILPGATRKKIPRARLIHEPEATVAPGFIDLHVHGGCGRDVMEGSLEALQEISAGLARHGVTAFLPTTVSASAADMEAALAGLAEHRSKIADGALPLGVHMEGPYLNPARKGTHAAAHLRPAQAPEFRRYLQQSGNTIRRITIAPEMDPDLAVIRQAASLGIRVALGHTDATLEESRAAIEAGARSATHTFNAMRPFHHREPGVLGAALTDARVFTEIIADGIHVHPLAVQLLLRAKGAKLTVLASDGISAVDMPDGVYPLGEEQVTVKNGRCIGPDGALAGSTLTLDRAVRNLVEWGLPAQDAVIAATAAPASSMGIEVAKGIIAPGADADLVFLNKRLEVVQTMIAGRIVYSMDGVGPR
jgi:N-acetylglucosamine-6-phosphate deacetylase